MIKIDELKFDSNGLIPAIVVDAVTKEVLTLAYMNKESLAITLEKGLTCFYSRSRQELWLKGETSGNYQHVVSITADCDKDALVVKVEKDGPACHTGEESCFFNPLYISEERGEFSLRGLYGLLLDRKATIYEIDDLAYHVMVLMTEMGITVDEVQQELASRHVIDHKVKQEKMTK